MKAQPFTISLIEDDPGIRESLNLFIGRKSLVEIISLHDSVESFMEHQFSDAPNMLLLDIGLPGKSGLEGIPIIKKKYSEIDIIMLTTYEEDDIIFAALSAGACSYISKRTPLSKIVEAIDIVANGGSYMSPGIAKKITRYFVNSPKEVSTKLSNRQIEITKYVVDGFTYSQIAEKCFISLNTVRSHIKNIYSVLEINNKANLIKMYNDGKV